MMTYNVNAQGQEQLALNPYRDEDVVFFSDGLVGFEDCKRFVIAENKNLEPLYLMQCVDRPEVGFLVLDPRMLIEDYCSDLLKDEQLLPLVTVIVGETPEECTANLRAPVLIDYVNMAGRQTILREPQYSVTHQVIAPQQKARRATASAIN